MYVSHKHQFIGLVIRLITADGLDNDELYSQINRNAIFLVI
jgi:hypothetical protein